MAEAEGRMKGHVRCHLQPVPERPPDVREGGGAREDEQRPAAGSSLWRLDRGGQEGGQERPRGVQEGATEDGGQGRRRGTPADAAGVLEHLQGFAPYVQRGGWLHVDQQRDVARGERGGARAAGLAARREDRLPGSRRV